MKKVLIYDKDGNSEEVNSSELDFRPSVYGIVIEDGKVLLSKQWDGYDFPGGGIEKHETIEQALKREFWEEAGLDVEVLDLVHAQTSFYQYHGGKFNCILLYYLCRRVGGELSIDNADETEKEYMQMPEWIDLNSISDIIFYNSIDSIELLEKLK